MGYNSEFFAFLVESLKKFSKIRSFSLNLARNYLGKNPENIKLLSELM